MAFDIETLVPELWCSDFEASLEFYTTILGFEVAQRRGTDPHAYLRLHKAQIMIAHWELDGNWVPWTPNHMVRPYGRGINFQFMVPDVDERYEAVLASGTEPLRPIYDMEIWKTECMDLRRQFMVSDPDGYILRFAQSLRTRPVEKEDLEKLDTQYGIETP